MSPWGAEAAETRLRGGRLSPGQLRRGPFQKRVRMADGPILRVQLDTDAIKKHSMF